MRLLPKKIFKMIYNINRYKNIFLVKIWDKSILLLNRLSFWFFNKKGTQNNLINLKKGIENFKFQLYFSH